jgi:2-polyprenyl-6-hydroxyphenyl methylase/3-demethylubiquinone-9 3-methyltransferase
MKNHKEFYEEYWGNDKVAPEKDPTTTQRNHLLINSLRKQKSRKDISILDAGCGNGYFAYFLESKGYRTIGIDISNKAIKKAKTVYPGIKFKVCSLEDKLFFEDKMFDVVWSTEVIEHIYYIYNYLFEMNRILKLGGLFVITTPYHGLLKNLAIVLFGFDKHFCNIKGGHIRFFSNKCLEKLFNRFGFKIIEKKYIGRIWPFSKSIYLVGRKIKDV